VLSRTDACYHNIHATYADVCCNLAVKALYVMGGSAHKGNITSTAEFNFHCDPEAAFLVLKKVRDCHALLQDVIYYRSLNNCVA